MKRILSIILGIIFITGCGEAIPKPDPLPPPDLQPRLEEPPPPLNPPYTESCSDMPERAALENAEANVYEIWLACLIKNHPEQGRPTMSYHPKLGEVARTRADDIVINGLSSVEGHVDIWGFGPNYYVCLTGYNADFCPPEDPRRNTIESGSGCFDPESALIGWLNSPKHRVHVLGEDGSEDELYYGVGYSYAAYPPDYTDGINVCIFIAARPPLDEVTD